MDWRAAPTDLFKTMGLSAAGGAVAETRNRKVAELAGDVHGVMDRALGRPVFKISGTVPAGNYLALPKAPSQSLALRDEFLYLLIKPATGKFYTIHLDILTSDSLSLRLSLSNLYKRPKVTPLLVQLPLQLKPVWTVLGLDLNLILLTTAKRTYSALKRIRLCSSMSVRGVFASSSTFGVANDAPKSMAFPSPPPGRAWNQTYDALALPSNSPLAEEFATSLARAELTRQDELAKENLADNFSSSLHVAHTTNASSNTANPNKSAPASKSVSFAAPQGSSNPDVLSPPPTKTLLFHPEALESSSAPAPPVPTISVNPALALERVIGFSGAIPAGSSWCLGGSHVLTVAGPALVATNVSDGSQFTLTGHTSRIQKVTVEPVSGDLVATTADGPDSGAVRVWSLARQKQVTVLRNHRHNVTSLAWSLNGRRLAGVGRDAAGRAHIIIWDTTRVAATGRATISVSTVTEAPMTAFVPVPWELDKWVSYGPRSVRFWRVRDGKLRSGALSLGDFAGHNFTAVAWEGGECGGDVTGKRLYVAADDGVLFQVAYQNRSLEAVYRLHNASITSLDVSEGLVVTGGADGLMRVWPADFTAFLLEVRYDGAVSSVSLSLDGLTLLIGTASGAVGLFDIRSHAYTTLARAHTGSVTDVAMDPSQPQMASVSADSTVRVWDMITGAQLVEFDAPGDPATCVAYHPSAQLLAAGFSSGSVRTLDVAAATTVSEWRQHTGQVNDVAFVADGSRLLSLGADGHIVEYSVGPDGILTPTRSLTAACSATPGATPATPVPRLAVPPVGHVIAVVGSDRSSVCLVALEALSVAAVLQISEPIHQLVFSADGRDLLVTTANRLLRLSSPSGKVLSSFSLPHASAREPGTTSMALSPSGTVLATGGTDGFLRLWPGRQSTGNQAPVPQSFVTTPGALVSTQWSRDGQFLVSASGSEIILWRWLGPRSGRAGPPEVDTMVSVQMEANLLAMSTASADMQQKASMPLAPGGVGLNPEESQGGQGEESSLNGHAPSPRRVAPRPHDPPMSATPVSAAKTALAARAAKTRSVSPAVRSDTPVGRRGMGESSDGAGTGGRQGSGQVNAGSLGVPADLPLVHFVASSDRAKLAEKRWIAGADQAGLSLLRVVGYSGGRGHNNTIWNPESGFFAYASGSTVLVEGLDAERSQSQLIGHIEEISCLAFSPATHSLASASGSSDLTQSAHICIWDTFTGTASRVLSYHDSGVQDMAFSENGEWLVSIGTFSERSVVVWDVEAGTVAAVSSTDAPIHAVEWVPGTTGEFVTVGSRAISAWLVAPDGLRVSEVPLPAGYAATGPVHCSVGFHGPNTAIIGTADGRLAVASLATNSFLGVIQGAESGTEITTLTCQGDLLVAGDAKGALRVWDLAGIERNKPVEGIEPPVLEIPRLHEAKLDGAIVSATWNRNVDLGIVGTAAGSIWFVRWDGSKVRLVASHSGLVNTAGFCGRTSVPAKRSTPGAKGNKSSVRGGMVNRRPGAGAGAGEGIGAESEPQNDGSLCFATGGFDGSLRLWQGLHSCEQVVQFQVGADVECTVLKFAAGGSSVLAGYSDGTLRKYNVEALSMTAKWNVHAGSAVTKITLSPDGATALSGCQSGEIVVLDVKSDTGPLQTITHHVGAAVEALDVHRYDPRLWLAASHSGQLSLWSAEWGESPTMQVVDWITLGTSRMLGSFDETRPVLAVFSPSEQTVIVTTGLTASNEILFYDFQRKQELRRFSIIPETQVISSLSVSDNGYYIAAGTRERVLKLIDYDAGSFQDFVGHSDAVKDVVFAPGSRSLVSVSNSDVLIWSVL